MYALLCLEGDGRKQAVAALQVVSLVVGAELSSLAPRTALCSACVAAVRNYARRATMGGACICGHAGLGANRWTLALLDMYPSTRCVRVRRTLQLALSPRLRYSYSYSY